MLSMGVCSRYWESEQVVEMETTVVQGCQSVAEGAIPALVEVSWARLQARIDFAPGFVFPAARYLMETRKVCCR